MDRSGNGGKSARLHDASDVLRLGFVPTKSIENCLVCGISLPSEFLFEPLGHLLGGETLLLPFGYQHIEVDILDPTMRALPLDDDGDLALHGSSPCTWVIVPRMTCS